MTNGNGKLVYWLLGFFATVVLSLAGAWALSIDRKLERIVEVHEELKPRVAVTEFRVTALENSYKNINDKLDKLIQRGNR